MDASIESLHFYPVKGCRGFTIEHAMLATTGLELHGVGDREWVVVDENGRFLSQRELPKMALIETKLGPGALRLKAPGMLALDVPLASEGDVLPVTVWNDTLPAVTQGDLPDAWFSRYLGRPCRLMRFDPEARRLSNKRYTGDAEAPVKFADAFALLVTSASALADLNARLEKRGASPVGMERFRPNIVLAGVAAHEEDYAASLTVGDVEMRLVKPCVRCTVPSVDPATGEQGAEPGDTLALYRDDTRVGGVTFGMNAIVVGQGGEIRSDDVASLTLAL